MSGHHGTMNGKPCWSPSARTKDFDFAPAEPEDDHLAVLAEAAKLVKRAIAQGLIKPPDYVEQRAKKLGSRSEWATCQTCRCEFTRDKLGKEPKCQVCRLAKKTCKRCGIEFQPQQRKQVVCGMACRTELARTVAQIRMTGTVTVPCAWCGNPFNRRAQDMRKTNCSKECGFKSMAAKLRKAK